MRNRTHTNPPREAASLLALTVAISLGLLTDCALNKPGLVLDPVGPPPGATGQTHLDGTLVVYSAYSVHGSSAAWDRPAHTPYKLLAVGKPEPHHMTNITKHIHRYAMVAPVIAGMSTRADILELKNGGVLSGGYAGVQGFETSAGQQVLDTSQIVALTVTTPPAARRSWTMISGKPSC